MPTTEDDNRTEYPIRSFGKEIEEAQAILRKSKLRLPTTEHDLANLVKLDIEHRIVIGVKYYGERLRINNGRDALQDAYEEALDLCLYLKQVIEERKTESPTKMRRKRDENYFSIFLTLAK